MKRVNPKSIKISDEIEKRPKRGLLYFSLFVGCSKFGIFETINDNLSVRLLVFTGRRRAQITQRNADLFSFKTINDLRSSASSAKSASGNTNVASYR